LDHRGSKGVALLLLARWARGQGKAQQSRIGKTMSDVVFILGAGASRECGGPLMWDFLDVARKLLSFGKVEDSRGPFDRIFKTIGHLQQVHSKAQFDLNNIESIFSALELGKTIQKVPGLRPDEIQAAIDDLKLLIVRTLEERVRFPKGGNHSKISRPDECSSFARLIEHLMRRTGRLTTISIITFNYDLVMDVLLSSLSVGPNYCLDDQSRGSIELLKLHGSLNWAAEKNNGKIREFPIKTFLERYFQEQYGLPAALRVHHDFEHYFNYAHQIKVDPLPVIIPPSWYKGEYHASLTDIWARAAKHLSEARHVVVIGYSLPVTDSFFRHLYALGSVGPDPLESFTVVDTDKKGGKVDRRFQRLIGMGARSRYRYISAPFSECADHIIDIISPHDPHGDPIN
jgi:hypothetical protein